MTATKKYNIIYADPPWQFKTFSDKGKDRSPEKHYECMTIEDIKKLNVADYCDKDAVLLMWVTWPLLQEGLDVIKAWGFKYKTCAFNWVKRNKKQKDKFFIGLGYYTRANSEVCLLATRGKPLKRFSKSVEQIVDTPIERHSKKPDCVRTRIVELFGDLPRIELFAREKTLGWDVFGNEVKSDIQLEVK